MNNNFNLKDLGEMVSSIRKRIATEFSNKDIYLSRGFMDAYSKYASKTGNIVDFEETTTTITTSGKLKIYMPNQWFLLASYAVDFVKEIIRYRAITEAVIDKNGKDFKNAAGKVLEKKDIYKTLKNEHSNNLTQVFKNDLHRYLLSMNDSAIDSDEKLVYRFVSDEQWWLGGKGIDRANDYYVSPVLSVLNLVNVSQNYVATIAYAYATNSALYDQLSTMISAESVIDNAVSEDEYQRAAKVLTDHINEAGLTLDKRSDDVNAVRQELLARFSPKLLASLPDGQLLTTLFYSANSDNDSLCYFLEFNRNSRELFGSIAGGSSYKFILFQNKEDGQWTTGSPTRPKKLSEAQALKLGKQIRYYLVKGAEIIDKAVLNTPEDYEALDHDLMAATDGKCTFAWVHKYYTILFPDKLTPFHSYDWQRHVLYALRIKPSQTYYGRDGQISIVRKIAGLDYVSFFQTFNDRFGSFRKFIRLGTTDNNGNHYAEILRRDNAVGIGWNKIGPLSDYVTGNAINKQAITDALKEKYYPDSSQSNIATRKAGELATFYNADSGTVFVIMDGERVLALADEIGENYFADGERLAHRRHAVWHLSFSNNDVLPNQSEGHLTSCYELKKEENLLFLYEKYYYGTDEESGDENMNLNNPFTEPVYNTSFSTVFPLNRIVFGAPGTGKSYKLENDRKALLASTGDYERVTFHPDYTYSQFVGSYKPVSDGREIYYKFVPGPFMRIYVKAIRNGKTDTPEPYILLIEEINRAPVAAVFGDVFQLLDRNDDGVSQYEIEASEDIRRYLADELGGDPTDYEKIKIPNNMLIWATMNSADQGVFPMDTAFKRRWNFEYIGIDENDRDLKGKYVTLSTDRSQRFEWNALRKAINNYLSKEKINEDKQLGPYFLSRKIVVPDDGDEIDSEKFADAFKSKVLMYLFEDAARQRRPGLFKGCSNPNRYSEICEEFDVKGIDIFNESIVKDTDVELSSFEQTSLLSGAEE